MMNNHKIMRNRVIARSRTGRAAAALDVHTLGARSERDAVKADLLKETHA